MEDTKVCLKQHITTSPDGSMTETTSCYETSSEDGGGGTSPAWFGTMNSISTLARTIGQNLDGFASAVNRGARNIIQELAELENETMRHYEEYASSEEGEGLVVLSGQRRGEREQEEEEEENLILSFPEVSVGGVGGAKAGASVISRTTSTNRSITVPFFGNNTSSSRILDDVSMKNFLPLPWEICIQRATSSDGMVMTVEHKEDKKIKEKILALSLNDNAFVGPFSKDQKVSRSFHFDKACVTLIQRLLAIDPNLSRIHAKISGTCIEIMDR
jgi:hypothetical protein